MAKGTSERPPPRPAGSSSISPPIEWSQVAATVQTYLQQGKRGSTTEAVTDALREAILDGLIAPSTWLREEELAGALNVSRTPVRESLRKLADERLVNRTANRGSVVQAMTLDEVYAVYLVREALESLTAFTVSARPQPGVLDDLVAIQEANREATEAMDIVRAGQLNLDFHRVLRTATGNPYLIRFLEQLENAVRRSGVLAFGRVERMHESLEEHRLILEAIASSNPEAAQDAMVRHIRLARDARMQAVIGPSPGAMRPSNT